MYDFLHVTCRMHKMWLTEIIFLKDTGWLVT